MGLCSVKYTHIDKTVRVTVSNCKVKIQIAETSTNNEVYSCENIIKGKQSVWAKLTRQWHCDYTIKIFIDNSLSHIEHTTIKNKTVLVRLDSVALGDTIGWFPYVLEFQKRYGCNVLVSTFHNYLLEKYETPNLTLINPNDTPKDIEVEYKIGVFQDSNLDPINFRHKPLQKCAADILNVPYIEHHLDLKHLAGIRPIAPRYVVINTTSTMDCKEWQNPTGWQEVINYLKTYFEYKIVCIPPPTIPLKGLEEIDIPKDLITGALTYIKHAEYVIGLSSGLSWLARTVDTPVVMLAGFTEPFNEFKTNIKRIINKDVCYGCYHDTSVVYDRYRNWCPRNKSFECSKQISSNDIVEGMKDLYRQNREKIGPKKKLLCILPHCSTGGLPQYFLEKLKVLRKELDVDVIEWSFSGEAHNVQRKEIRELCRNFFELNGGYRKDLQSIVDQIVPDFIHFEESPSMYQESHLLQGLHNLHRQKIFHTSHSYQHQEVWNADKYIFPSAYHKIVYPELNCQILEYPIIPKEYSGSKREKTVLNVGIISAHKNQRYLVELARLMPDVTFMFAGGLADNFRSYWEPLLAAAPKNCIFLGQQNQKQLDELYKTCNLMFHTSTIELCPIVFNEAISYSLPILVNYLSMFDHLSYKEYLNKATMNHQQDVELVRKMLESKEVKIPRSTYIKYKTDLLDMYQDNSSPVKTIYSMW